MKKITIELMEDQAQVVIQGLSMLPYRDSAQLINYVHKQLYPPVTSEKPKDKKPPMTRNKDKSK